MNFLIDHFGKARVYGTCFVMLAVGNTAWCARTFAHNDHEMSGSISLLSNANSSTNLNARKGSGWRDEALQCNNDAGDKTCLCCCALSASMVFGQQGWRPLHRDPNVPPPSGGVVIDQSFL